MTEKSSITKGLADLRLTNNIERQLRLDQGELAKALRPMQEMGILARASMLSLQRFSVDLAASPLFKEMSIASSAISAFRDTPQFHALQADAARISEVTAGIGKELALTLAPMRIVVADLQLGFAANRQILEGVKLGADSLIRAFEPVAVNLARIAQISFAIPESAVLQWSSDVLADRTTLVKDCLLNTSALEQFYAATTRPDAAVSAEQFRVASQFVFDHAEVVRHLPPAAVHSRKRADGGRQIAS